MGTNNEAKMTKAVSRDSILENGQLGMSYECYQCVGGSLRALGVSGGGSAGGGCDESSCLAKSRSCASDLGVIIADNQAESGAMRNGSEREALPDGTAVLVPDKEHILHRGHIVDDCADDLALPIGYRVVEIDDTGSSELRNSQHGKVGK